MHICIHPNRREQATVSIPIRTQYVKIGSLLDTGGYDYCSVLVATKQGILLSWSWYALALFAHSSCFAHSLFFVRSLFFAHSMFFVCSILLLHTWLS
jgi:hypothetical protein